MRPSRTGLLVAFVLIPAPAFAGRISVTTDVRLELIGAAQFVAPAGARPHGFSAPDIPYTRALKKKLARFIELPAIRMNAEPKMLEFSFADRSQLLMRLSSLPELSERLTVQYALIDRAGGPENLRRWLSALRDLSKAARFQELFAEEAKEIEPALAGFRSKESKQDYLGTIEAYAGLPLLGTYSIYLSPFQAPGGVANAVSELEDGSMEISSVVGPNIQETGIDFWSERVPGTLWHESAHGVIDGLGDLYADKIALSKANHAGIGWSCYGTWNQCVKEHFVRAVMIRLIAREISEEAAEEQLRFENVAHYPYMRAILEKLKIYEAERGRYPTLADYYPQLLEVFPTQGRPEAKPEQALSGTLQRRAQRMAQAIVERAKQPEALALARRYAAPIDQTSSLGEKPVGPRQMGIEAYSAGRKEDALRYFEEALKATPDDIETLMSRAVVLQSLGQGAQALASYDRAAVLAAAGNHGQIRALLPDILTSRASLLLELGERERAVSDLRHALDVSAEDWPHRAAIQARIKSLSAEKLR